MKIQDYTHNIYKMGGAQVCRVELVHVQKIWRKQCKNVEGCRDRSVEKKKPYAAKQEMMDNGM